MRIMYHQKSFLYDLTRPYLGRCDVMLRLKLFLKKVSFSQLLFDRLLGRNIKEKKLLLLVDDDGTNSTKTPAATDNRTFGLVNNTDDDYPDDSAECRTLTIYNDNNNNNNIYLMSAWHRGCTHPVKG